MGIDYLFGVDIMSSLERFGYMWFFCNWWLMSCFVFFRVFCRVVVDVEVGIVEFNKEDGIFKIWDISVYKKLKINEKNEKI